MSESMTNPHAMTQSPAPKLTIGRIVHYGIGVDYDGKVVRRPAIVVADYYGAETPHPNLQVFLDGSNDRRYREIAQAGLDASAARGESPAGTPYAEPTPEECARGFAWRTSANPGEGVGEWCWPPRS